MSLKIRYAPHHNYRDISDLKIHNIPKFSRLRRKSRVLHYCEGHLEHILIVKQRFPTSREKFVILPCNLNGLDHCISLNRHLTWPNPFRSEAKIGFLADRKMSFYDKYNTMLI